MSIFFKKRKPGLTSELRTLLTEFSETQISIPYPTKTSANVDRVKKLEWYFLRKCFEAAQTPDEVFSLLRPAFQSFQYKYEKVLDVVESNGFEVCKFGRFHKNKNHNRKIYFYHDVHAWDIFPALALVDTNIQRNICTTFFLNWRCDGVDADNEIAYMLFQQLVGENVEIGMHAAPLSTWILSEVFKDDQELFVKWVYSDSIKNDILALIDPSMPPAFNQFRMCDVKSSLRIFFPKFLREFKKEFPQAITLNHHGDQVAREIIGIYSDSSSGIHSKEKKKIITGDLRDLLSVNWMMSTNILKYGFKDCVPSAFVRCGGRNGKLVHFPEGKNKQDYLDNLDKALKKAAEKGVPVTLINHPAGFSNGKLVIT